MNQQVDAIYDCGVFRPLQPLTLPDLTRVKLTIEAEALQETCDKIDRQKAALRARWHEIDSGAHPQNNDDWSVRQHDELLYGQQ